MNEQLKLEMSKKWCTAGCGLLLSDEDFKTHRCVVRDVEDKKKRGIRVATKAPEEVQRDRRRAEEHQQRRTVGEIQQASARSPEYHTPPTPPPAKVATLTHQPGPGSTAKRKSESSSKPEWLRSDSQTFDLINGMMHQATVCRQPTGEGTKEAVDERNRVPSLHPWIETPDRTSMDVIEFILKHYERCHLSFSEEKWEEYKQVCKARPQFKHPDDLVPRQPFRNGTGPQGGRNEQHGYSGDIILRTPEDLEELKVFDRFGHFAVQGERYRKERLKLKGKNKKHIHIQDTRLLLFLMDRYPEKVKLDPKGYPTAKRYRPYDPEGARLRKEKNKKEGAA